jgi:two-component system response regulator YesN
MYRIILVEDEPEAAQNIRDIINIHCPLFTIAAAGSSGAEGLELARRHRPDLLLTDIRMPGMNGLELITRLHNDMPDLITMLISGYQDFEYARTALQQGALDYLLKPIGPSTLKKALEHSIPIIDKNRETCRLKLIRRLMNNDIPGRDELENNFPNPLYAALSRKNGLPRRFSLNSSLTKYEIHGDTIDISGRDEMESLHITPDKSFLFYKSFDEIGWLHRDIAGYATTVICDKPFQAEDLPNILKCLYNTLDSNLIIDMDKVVISGGTNSGKKINPDFTFKTRLSHYLHEKQNGQVTGLLVELLLKWKNEQQTQFFVEESIRSFFDQIRFESGCECRDEEFEFMLEDAFFYAANYTDLKESMLSILDKLLSSRNGIFDKFDTQIGRAHV